MLLTAKAESMDGSPGLPIMGVPRLENRVNDPNRDFVRPGTYCGPNVYDLRLVLEETLKLGLQAPGIGTGCGLSFSITLQQVSASDFR